MILLDLSQVMISNLMMHLSMESSGANPYPDVDEGMMRHMVLSSIVSYRKRFGDQYGDMVICVDDKNVWRRDLFPYYKANRKRDRDASGIDWGNVFGALDTIKSEIREHLPYHVVQVERAEADDVIASLCHLYGDYRTDNVTSRILILSGDKDFGQLQKYTNVDQFAPVQKKFMPVNNPERFKREHIMLGDKGDGVPNFLSDDDTFIANKRQRPIPRKKLEEWSMLKPEDFCDDKMLRGYKRNEQLIDLDLIPGEIQHLVVDNFHNQIPPSRSGILNYLMSHKLRNLTTRLGDF